MDDNELEDINRYGNSDELEDVFLEDALRSWTEDDYTHMWDEDGGEGQWTNFDKEEKNIRSTEVRLKVSPQIMARGKKGENKWTEIKQENLRIDPEAERWLEYEREVSAARKAKKRISMARDKHRMMVKENYKQVSETQNKAKRHYIGCGSMKTPTFNIVPTAHEEAISRQREQISHISTAPGIQDLTGLDMRYWEEQIEQYRADLKGYAYAQDRSNYYAELKGVEEEIKFALRKSDGETRVAGTRPAETRGVSQLEKMTDKFWGQRKMMSSARTEDQFCTVYSGADEQNNIMDGIDSNKRTGDDNLKRGKDVSTEHEA